ncbi:uncharacterized protein LOC103702440 [Phoenix dactylifera]|uniref:Uncharacterized protein LOC103702440 n=1 Tax=Phoenix dactylifera TaxID=42345 RepID=A0A8B7BQC4_PHODC|nr:uncharacterized protein LOC103702440 [Phoenix dactylifera]
MEEGEKHGEEATSNKTAQCSVISIYQANIVGVPRNVTVVWSKNLMNHSLSVSVEKSNGDSPLTCKVELKPWPFWSKKGFKSLEIDGERVDLYWDLRSAKFSNGPEPSGGHHYVALVCNEEVVLLLGDCKKEAYRRTKCRPALESAALVSRRENVFGKKCFTTRARFDERKKEHDIVVENSISGPQDPEMWISIDGVVLIHVSNLQWKFRGNETVLVEKVPVQVFWDVHDWLFGSPGTGHALFIFKPAAEGDRNGNPSSPAPEFCFFLCAWKTE